MTQTAKALGQTAAIIGLGSVGSGWAALMLAHDLSVRGFDPAEDGVEKSKTFICQSWPSLVQLGLAKTAEPPFENMVFCSDITSVVQGANVIIENVPEKIELKQSVISQVDADASPTALILSSSGGISASDMQKVCNYPDRLLVMHPFNPSHLIPLVEVVPGKQTSVDATERALEFARGIGKHPIVVNGENSGHMVNRLQFALVREAIRCMVDGVATPDDIDAAVRYGLAPRWMLMGGLQTVALAGGPGGMRGILDHAGSAMEEWWSTEKDFKLTPEIKDKLCGAADEVLAGAAFNDWAEWRDENLVNFLDMQAKVDSKRPGNT